MPHPFHKHSHPFQQRSSGAVMASDSSLNELTLCIPGLLGPKQASSGPDIFTGLSLTALETFLARAQALSCFDGSLESVLFDCFGMPDTDATRLPVAPLTYPLDSGEGSQRYCLRADPVLLQIDRDRLVMKGQAGLVITQTEADLLVGEINAHCSEGRWILSAPHPMRWYLHLKSKPQIQTHPLPHLTQQGIYDYMPYGADQTYWRSLFNEIQMLLHSSSVNAARTASGYEPINSLWFWGGGFENDIVAETGMGSSSWARVYSNEALTAAFAHRQHIKMAACPTSADECLAQLDAMNEAGQTLVVLDQLREAADCVDVEGYRAGLEWIEAAWFAPLLAALRDRRLGRITVIMGEAGQQFSLTPRRLTFNLRRRQTVGHYAND